MGSRLLFCVLLGISGALASPASYGSSEVTSETSLQQREYQLMSIAEGGRQLYLLLSEALERGQQQARALTSGMTVSSVARALHNSDPVEVALNSVELDTQPCRERVICELQGLFDRRQFGDIAYELLVRGVPSLRKYGYKSARSLNARSCSELFQCRLSDSPVMERAREMRSLADSFCDTEGDSFVSRVCRALIFTVDTLETM